MKLKTYRDEKPYLVFDEIRKIFNDTATTFDLKKIGEENKVVDTVRALIMLSIALSRLCQSVLSCGDYYTAAIIYRAMIEHFLKHIYLFKSCIKYGDAIAKEYCEDHISSELLQKGLKALRPHTINPTNDFRKFKKKSDEISDKFRFSKILENIIEELGEDENEKILRSIAVQYSALSSYVHAGPIAVLDPEEKPKKNLDINSVFLTIIAYQNTIHLLSFYLSEHQDKLKEIYKEIKNKVRETLVMYEKNYIS